MLACKSLRNSRLHALGRVRLARFAREDYDYGASRLPNREEKTTVLLLSVTAPVQPAIKSRYAGLREQNNSRYDNLKKKSKKTVNPFTPKAPYRAFKRSGLSHF